VSTPKKFNTSLADSQATAISPVSCGKFDFDAYAAYEAGLSDRCKEFVGAESGVLVHRRMRVAEVFRDGCRDMQASLEWQLGALKESMQYNADVPNFLEPWYGIGTAASAFGVDYSWPEKQAPVVNARFKNAAEALEAEFVPVEKTAIGAHTLNMIDFFLEKTGGKLPISLCDSQSPLNVATFLMHVDDFLTDLYMNPEGVVELLDRIAGLIVDFYRKQEQIIGECLVKPGHGFASSRHFEGNGFSDDMIHMLSPELYRTCIQPSFVKAGEAFGGGAFHSCGNWSKFIDMVKNIPRLLTVDGAFSGETDPDPNPSEPFAEAFAGSEIVLNARIVGDADTVTGTVEKLWKPGMKLIAVTYCKTPGEQEEVYNRIHQICK
jgi:hypothetical protein